MMGALKILMKRPSDMQIRVGNALFGLLIIGGTWYNLLYLGKTLDADFFWVTIGSFEIYIKYFLLIIGGIPFIMGVTNMCLLKTKYMKLLQSGISLFVLYMSFKVTESATLDFDSLLLVLGLVGIFFGITGKAITKTCLRYGEKVQKIRV